MSGETLRGGVRGTQLGGPDKAAEEIKRLWGDVRVTDATRELRIFMNEDDVRAAVRKDPAHCVFANACRRLYGSSKVLFFRTVAYVELPNEDGTIRVERFSMPRTMRAMVDAFDRGEGVIPKAGFVLKPPTPGRTLAHGTKKNKKRKMKRERQMLLGEASQGIGTGMGKYRDKPIAIDLAVRSGTGAVHFTMKGEEEMP
jgi:hypothetical protein